MKSPPGCTASVKLVADWKRVLAPEFLAISDLSVGMLLARGTISNRFAADLFEARFLSIEFAYCGVDSFRFHFE